MRRSHHWPNGLRWKASRTSTNRDWRFTIGGWVAINYVGEGSELSTTAAAVSIYAYEDESDALISKSTWPLKLSGLVFAGLLLIGRSASYGNVTWTPTYHSAFSPLIVQTGGQPRPAPAIPKVRTIDAAALSKPSAAEEVVTFSAGNAAGGSEGATGSKAGSGANQNGHGSINPGQREANECNSDSNGDINSKYHTGAKGNGGGGDDKKIKACGNEKASHGSAASAAGTAPASETAGTAGSAGSHASAKGSNGSAAKGTAAGNETAGTAGSAGSHASAKGSNGSAAKGTAPGNETAGTAGSAGSHASAQGSQGSAAKGTAPGNETAGTAGRDGCHAAGSATAQSTGSAASTSGVASATS